MLPSINNASSIQITNADILKEINSLSNGKQLNVTQRLSMFRKLIERGQIHTMEPLLPLLLTLKGKPYTLEEHFPFSPLFRTRMPTNLVVVSGRQVSKSTSLAANGVLVANSIPHFSTLYVTPLYEQI